MASPCEILIETDDAELARQLCLSGQREARRIEQKFSRYRDDNIVHQINQGQGQAIDIDNETYRLLQFADRCYQLSDGLFDITSGVLGKAWRFDGSNRLPGQSQLDELLCTVGWEKVEFNPQYVRLPAGMQIDFGGIGKEYAVDKVLTDLKQHCDREIMVNFGGDCHASGPPAQQGAWMTGIENPLKPGDAAEVIRLARGALATSGDAYRFIVANGKRYGHILNPKTGWPATDSPRSVTVAAGTCTEAGILSTLAILQGKDAESFLDAQQVKYWCYR